MTKEEEQKANELVEQLNAMFPEANIILLMNKRGTGTLEIFGNRETNILMDMLADISAQLHINRFRKNG